MKIFSSSLELEQMVVYIFVNKEKVHDEIFDLLHEYPQNFLHGHFETWADEDYKESEIMTAQYAGKIIGCLFYNKITHEFNWLAVSSKIPKGKREIAKKLFEHIFETLSEGTSFFWYVNTEDSVYDGYPELGKYFEPARALYKSMGLTFTRVENKFGKGAHAYRVEGIIKK